MPAKHGGAQFNDLSYCPRCKSVYYLAHEDGVCPDCFILGATFKLLPIIESCHAPHRYLLSGAQCPHCDYVKAKPAQQPSLGFGALSQSTSPGPALYPSKEGNYWVFGYGSPAWSNGFWDADLQSWLFGVEHPCKHPLPFTEDGTKPTEPPYLKIEKEA